MHNQKQELKTASPADLSLPPREWLRVAEALKWTGWSKPTLYTLINNGKVKSVSLRQRGQVRGTRLVNFDSLRSFLNSIATGGDTPA